MAVKAYRPLPRTVKSQPMSTNGAKKNENDVRSIKVLKKSLKKIPKSSKIRREVNTT